MGAKGTTFVAKGFEHSSQCSKRAKAVEERSMEHLTDHARKGRVMTVGLDGQIARTEEGNLPARCRCHNPSNLAHFQLRF